MLRRPPDLHGRRVVGVDMARCLALLGMMATHILPGYEGLEIPGRSSWRAGGPPRSSPYWRV